LGILIGSYPNWFGLHGNLGYVFLPYLEDVPAQVLQALDIMGTLIALHLSWRIGIPSQINPFLLILLFEGQDALNDIELVQKVRPELAEGLACWPKLGQWPEDGTLSGQAACLYRSVHPVCPHSLSFISTFLIDQIRQHRQRSLSTLNTHRSILAEYIDSNC
jgi:hypothetical protein